MSGPAQLDGPAGSAFLTPQRGWHMSSDHVRKRALHPSEVEQSCHEDHYRDADGSNEELVRRCSSEQRPPKHFDDANHRVEGIKELGSAARDQLRGVGNWRQEEENLNKPRQHELNVTELDVERRQPHAKPESSQRRQHGRRRKSQELPTRRNSVADHENHEHRKRNREVDQAGENRSQRNEQAGKVHLCDQAAVLDEAAPGPAERTRERQPREKCRESEDRIGNAVRRKVGELPEYEAEYDHDNNRLDYYPAQP